MDRCIGWLTACWAGLLGAALLLLSLGLASYRVAAVGADQTAAMPEKQNQSSPENSATTKTKREALRYSGKNFEQWRVELETELKPGFRADGLTAMGAFGANGYGTQAARVIVDLMKGYHPNTDNERDKKVIAEAFAAIGKIEKPAYPLLWEELSGDNEHGRLFAIACFQRSGTDWHPPVSALLKAIKEGGPETREIALGLLQNVEDKPKSCIHLLIECLKDEEHFGIRMEAMRYLSMFGPDAKDALPQLRRLRDKPIPGSPPFLTSAQKQNLDVILETIKKIEGK